MKSQPQDDVYDERIYIGEAEKLGKRLKQHLANSNKEFTEVVCFMSKDQLLTKSHIKYLESKIISQAKETKSAEIENNTQPEEPSLPEADISDMEYFLEQIKLILPVMNFMFLVPSVVKHNSNEFKNNQMQNESENKIYFLKNKQYNAKMYEADQGYIVLTGSTCSKNESKSISEGWLKIKSKLIASGVLKLNGDHYIFAEDTVFSSTSAASSVILGRQSPGPIVWVDEKGRTYKENQESKYELNDEEESL